jgi:hypothetical protein
VIDIDFEKMLESIAIACATLGVVLFISFLLMVIGSADYGAN